MVSGVRTSINLLPKRFCNATHYERRKKKKSNSLSPPSGSACTPFLRLRIISGEEAELLRPIYWSPVCETHARTNGGKHYTVYMNVLVCVCVFEKCRSCQCTFVYARICSRISVRLIYNVTSHPLMGTHHSKILSGTVSVVNRYALRTVRISSNDCYHYYNNCAIDNSDEFKNFNERVENIFVFQTDDLI